MRDGIHEGRLDLAGGHLLAKNTIYNLLGQLIPMAVAFVSIPFIIKGLGTERFGILSLAWVVVGYFSLLDVGIGRATKKYVAEYVGRGDIEELPKLVWTSVAMLGLFGATAAVLLAAFSSLFVNRVLNIPDSLRPETLRVLYLLAVSLPITLASDAVRGVLEAQQFFRLVNTVKMPAGVLSYILPLVLLRFSKSLYPITAALVANKLVVFLIFLYLCVARTPNMRRVAYPEFQQVKKLFGFGAWLTISNIIGPLMTYMDRFIIGTVLTMSAVAYYSTPYDLVARITIIPASLVGVVFPALSATYETDIRRFVFLYTRSSKYIMMALAPILLALVVLAAPFLRFWVGAAFARQSTLVLQLLAVGTLVNSFAMAPYSAIQAMDRPDLTAKFHLIELPLYLGTLWLLIGRLGIIGVALSWLLRVTIDALLLHHAADRMLARRAMQRSSLVAPLAGMTAALFVTVYVTRLLRTSIYNFFLLTCLLSLLGFVYWFYVITEDERFAACGLVRAVLRQLRPQNHIRYDGMDVPED